MADRSHFAGYYTTIATVISPRSAVADCQAVCKTGLDGCGWSDIIDRDAYLPALFTTIYLRNIESNDRVGGFTTMDESFTLYSGYYFRADRSGIRSRYQRLYLRLTSWGTGGILVDGNVPIGIYCRLVDVLISWR